MDEKTFEDHFKKTSYIFFMLLLGQISVFVFSLIIVENYNFKNESNLEDVFRILIPFVGIAVMFFVKIIYDKKISRIQVNEKVEDKLNKYRAIKIIQWVLIEGAGFLALAAFMLIGDYFYTIIFLFLIGYYILLRPTKAQLKTDMKM